MSENTEQVENATSSETTETKAERTFTQAEMEAIIGERLKRERSKYADYNEVKAKAAKFDEAEEAGKSELQKAVEERDKYKTELESLKAEAARAAKVAEIAKAQGVDAELLSRMSGDVEENAKFLKEQQESRPKYEAVHDGGEVTAPAAKHDIPIIF